MENDQGASSKGEGSTVADGTESSNDTQPRSIESYAAEMNRKHAQLSETITRQNQQLEQLLNYVARNQGAASVSSTASIESAEDKELEDLAYTNPKLYAKKVAEKATRAALSTVNSAVQSQQQQNLVLTQLANEYPELADNNSELTVKAVNIYKQLSESERAYPAAYKIAVRDAAAELGILPKNKRSVNPDNVNIGTSTPGIASTTRKPSSKQGADLSEQTLKWAQAMGLNVNDKKVIENIKSRVKKGGKDE